MIQLPKLPKIVTPPPAVLPGQTSKTPDPLADVEYTDNLQEDTARELDAVQQAYRDRAAAETKRFKNATDSEYWFAVCFTTREEKEAFLKAAGINPKTLGDKYISGREFAARVGVNY